MENRSPIWLLVQAKTERKRLVFSLQKPTTSTGGGGWVASLYDCNDSLE